ncbi:MAG: MFS transporter [Chloroflexota bacterium]
MREDLTSRYRFVIASLLTSKNFGTGIMMAAAASLLPLIMSEFGISRGTASWFFSAPQILTMTLAVPAAILANRIGLKKTFALGIFFHSASIIAPLCFNFPTLLITRLIFGIGSAISMPLSAGILAQWFNHRELPLANAFTRVSATVGQTIALFITIPIAGLLSWRGTIASYAAWNLLTAVLWLTLGREKPRAAAGNPVEFPIHSRQATAAKMTTWQVLKQRRTLLLGLSLMGAFSLYLSLSAWLPTYYYEVFNMPLAKASAVSAIFRATGIPGNILGGILAMRLGRRKPIIIVSGLMVGVMGLATFIINSPPVIFTALAIYGFFGVFYMPSIHTIPMEMPGMTPETGSLVLALALSIGNLGGFMGPIIVGYVADFTGSYLAGFLVCCVLSLSLLVGGLLLPETGPKARRNINPASVS